MRFDQHAQNYERDAHIQRQVAHWCAEWVETDLRDFSAIEFGAGPGVFTRELVRRHSHRLIATDISLPMIQQGQQNLPQVEWCPADAWAPPPAQVDRIYSTSLLQWAQNPTAVFKSWRQLMSPGGRLLISVFVEGSMLELVESCPQLIPLAWLPEWNWITACEAGGFQVTRWGLLGKRLFFPTAAQALRSVHRIGACPSQLCSPSTLKAGLRAYETQFRQEQGVPISWRALRLEATVPH